jgi:hypothetical protein
MCPDASVAGAVGLMFAAVAGVAEAGNVAFIDDEFAGSSDCPM